MHHVLPWKCFLLLSSYMIWKSACLYISMLKRIFQNATQSLFQHFIDYKVNILNKTKANCVCLLFCRNLENFNKQISVTIQDLMAVNITSTHRTTRVSFVWYGYENGLHAPGPKKCDFWDQKNVDTQDICSYKLNSLEIAPYFHEILVTCYPFIFRDLFPGFDLILRKLPKKVKDN